MGRHNGRELTRSSVHSAGESDAVSDSPGEDQPYTGGLAGALARHGPPIRRIDTMPQTIDPTWAKDVLQWWIAATGTTLMRDCRH